VADAKDDSTFLANRATGHIALTVAARDGRSHRQSVHEDGSLRVRFPNVEGRALEAVIVNTGGGMTGGDRFAVDIALAENAELVAGTAAAEKIYRSTGPNTEIALRLRVAAGARLAWLPQESILFDRARLTRSIDVDVADGGSLLVAEAVVFGRAAMGEAMAGGRFADRWRVHRAGRLVYADSLRLGGEIAATLGKAAVAGGGIAIATVLLVPAEEGALARQLEDVRALGDHFAGEVGISAWNGIAVARLCAKDGAALRHDLMAVLAALGTPVPRLWLS